MATINVEMKDIIMNNRDSETRAKLRKAVRKGLEIICCDSGSIDPIVMQDVIRYKGGVLRTYKFDSVKSQADKVYHIIPTGSIGGPDFGLDCVYDYIDNFMMKNYDLFIISRNNKFIHEPRLMGVYQGDKLIDGMVAR